MIMVSPISCLIAIVFILFNILSDVCANDDAEILRCVEHIQERFGNHYTSRECLNSIINNEEKKTAIVKESFSNHENKSHILLFKEPLQYSGFFLKYLASRVDYQYLKSIGEFCNFCDKFDNNSKDACLRDLNKGNLFLGYNKMQTFKIIVYHYTYKDFKTTHGQLFFLDIEGAIQKSPLLEGTKDIIDWCKWVIKNGGLSKLITEGVYNEVPETFVFIPYNASNSILAAMKDEEET